MSSEFNHFARKKLEFIRPSDINAIATRGMSGIQDIDFVAADAQNVADQGLETNVYLRLRPTKDRHDNYSVRDLNKLVVKSTLQKSKEVVEKTFEFSRVFGEEVSQRELYDECVNSSIEQLAEVEGATFLTYGTSGSGKTHTIVGDEAQPGIVPRAIVQIYSQFGQVIHKKPLFKTDFQRRKQVFLTDDDVTYDVDYSALLQQIATSEPGPKFNTLQDVISMEHVFGLADTSEMRYANVYVSFVEIYNETVRDLLELDNRHRSTLKIVGNDGYSYVANAQWVFAPTAEACFQIVQYGLRNVKFGETQVNARSSRSHTVLMIDFITFYRDRSIQQTLYKFCDLAGSERANKTKAEGERLAEAKQINKSLMTLGRCLQIIHNNQKGLASHVVPVRESKLTFLLQSALLGLQKLVMIVNLMPVDEFYDENMNVLNFSAIAKQIVKSKVEVKRDRRSSCFSSFFSLPARPTALLDSISESEAISSLVDENEHLKLEIRELKEQMLMQEMSLRSELIQDFESDKQRRDLFYEERQKNAVEREARKWQVKLITLERKNELLKEDLEDLEEQCAQHEDEIDKLREKLRKYVIENGDYDSDVVVEEM